jgi:hypothetical protein
MPSQPSPPSPPPQNHGHFGIPRRGVLLRQNDVNPPKDNLGLAMLLQNSGVRPEVSKALSELFEGRSANDREFWIRALAELSLKLTQLKARLFHVILLGYFACLLLALLAAAIYFRH